MKHEIHITHDDESGIIIQDIKCPFRDKLVIIEAHRDRLRKALHEIEERMRSHDRQLKGAYNQKLWVPVKVKREEDPRALPEHFDGLADWVEFLRPIIWGIK